jgi:hypothetical protein
MPALCKAAWLVYMTQGSCLGIKGRLLTSLQPVSPCEGGDCHFKYAKVTVTFKWMLQTSSKPASPPVVLDSGA